MFAITGITGQVGGTVAHTLLGRGQQVRAVVRDARKAPAWKALGCEVAIAEMSDGAALANAFCGAKAVFLLLPPVFDPSPNFAESSADIAGMRHALEAARPKRVVCISTIGAQAPHRNLLTQLGNMENVLSELALPITLLRPGWFMENCRWDVAPALERGVITSFLSPLDRAIPMVATEDVGRTAADLLLEQSTGTRIIELEGPARVSPSDIAKAFSEVIGKQVRAEALPRSAWESFFRSSGMQHPESRMRMLDGFNEGWIAFDGDPGDIRRGTTTLRSVIQALVDEASRSVVATK